MGCSTVDCKYKFSAEEIPCFTVDSRATGKLWKVPAWRIFVQQPSSAQEFSLQSTVGVSSLALYRTWVSVAESLLMETMFDLSLIMTFYFDSSFTQVHTSRPH